jgi:hypothetical protein
MTKIQLRFMDKKANNAPILVVWAAASLLSISDSLILILLLGNGDCNYERK